MMESAHASSRGGGGVYFHESSESSHHHTSEASEESGRFEVAPWHNPQLAEMFDSALRRSAGLAGHSGLPTNGLTVHSGFSAPIHSSSRSERVMNAVLKELGRSSEESAAAVSVGLYGSKQREHAEESSHEGASEGGEHVHESSEASETSANQRIALLLLKKLVQKRVGASK